MRDTIEMAREAGAMLYDSPKKPFKLIDIMFTPETLAAFEALVRADEREAIISRLLEIGALEDGAFIEAIQARGQP
jgi:hypothetical protein